MRKRQVRILQTLELSRENKKRAKINCGRIDFWSGKGFGSSLAKLEPKLLCILVRSGKVGVPLKGSSNLLSPVKHIAKCSSNKFLWPCRMLPCYSWRVWSCCCTHQNQLFYYHACYSSPCVVTSIFFCLSFSLCGMQFLISKLWMTILIRAQLATCLGKSFIRVIHGNEWVAF